MPIEEGLEWAQGPFWGWPHGTVTAVAFQEGNESAPAVQGTALPCRHLPEKTHSWKGAQSWPCLPCSSVSTGKVYLCVGEPLSAQPQAKGRPSLLTYSRAELRTRDFQSIFLPCLSIDLLSQLEAIPFHPSSSHSVHRGETPCSPVLLRMVIPHGLNPSPTPNRIGREEGIKHSPSLGPNLLPLQSLQRRLTHITLEGWLGEVFLPHSLIPHSVLKLPAQGKLHPALLLLPSPCTLQGPSPMGTSPLPARACCQLPLHPAKECLVSPEQGSGGQPRK